MGDKPFALLLVDDSRSTAAKLARSLGSSEYAPRVVPPGPDVPRLALGAELVLLCLESPAAPSSDEPLELLRRLMEVEGPGRGGPVVVVAPAEAVALRVAALRLGVEVVADPWDDEELRARLQRALSAHEVVVSLASQVADLQKLSVLDGLTLLHNHRYFQERLREEFRMAQRYDDVLSLILVDLDHFKAFNHKHGHSEGDDVLRKVARVLQQSVRETDLVARYGGQQFAVLLPRTPLTGAITVAERIWKELGALRVGQDPTVQVTASLGLSGFPHRSVLSSDQLLLTADEALYQAKREGRNRICLHSPVPFLSTAPRG